MRLRVAWAVMMLLSVPLAAEAMGFRRASQSVTYYSYYPAPVVFVPVPMALSPVQCMPPTQAPPSRIYATPTPAPPLGTSPAAPPPTAAPPAVKEIRSYFDAYAVAGLEGKPVDGQRCSVGFWNNTDQDLVLKIDGQPRNLPRGKGVTVDLPRTFVWQVEQREPRTESVAADRAGMEIVIRR